MSHFSGLLLVLAAGCLLRQSDAVAPTKWVLTGNVYCGFREEGSRGYLNTMELEEADVVFHKIAVKGGEIKANVTLNKNASPATYRVEVEATGEKFDPYFKILHSCTKDQKAVIKKIRVFGGGDTEVNDKTNYHHQNLNIMQAPEGRPARGSNINKNLPKELGALVKDGGRFAAADDKNKPCPCLHKVCSYHCMTRRAGGSIEKHGKNIDKLKPKMLDVCPCPWKICSYGCD